jgi:hypothetical protein
MDGGRRRGQAGAVPSPLGDGMAQSIGMFQQAIDELT